VGLVIINWKRVYHTAQSHPEASGSLFANVRARGSGAFTTASSPRNIERNGSVIKLRIELRANHLQSEMPVCLMEYKVSNIFKFSEFEQAQHN